MNTKQNIKQKLQLLALNAKLGKKDAVQSSKDVFGKFNYPFVAGYLESRLESIASDLQKLLDEMEEE